MCHPSERHTLTHRLPKEAWIRNDLEATAATRHDTLNGRMRNFVHVREVRQNLFPCRQDVVRGNYRSQEYITVPTQPLSQYLR